MAEVFREIDVPEIEVKGFGEEEAKGLFSVAVDFVRSYKEKPTDQENLSWLCNQMRKYMLDEMDDTSILQMSQDIMDSIDQYSGNMSDLQESRQNGQSREEWMQEKLVADAPGETMQEKGEYLQRILYSLSDGNALLTESAQHEGHCKIEIDSGEQEEKGEPQEWNRYTLGDVAAKIVQQAAMSGSVGMVVGGSMKALQTIRDAAAIVSEREDDEAEDIFTGIEKGLQAAGAGALVVCAKKGKIPFLDKNTDVCLLTNIACTGIGTVKSAYHFMKGKISASQAVDCLADAASVSVRTLCQKGIAAVAMRVHPITAAVAGTAIGQAVISAVSEGAGKLVAEGVRTLKPVVEPILEMAREIANTARNTIKSVVGVVHALL